MTVREEGASWRHNDTNAAAGRRCLGEMMEERSICPFSKLLFLQIVATLKAQKSAPNR